MAANPLLKRMLDAGMQFTEMSQKQAEKLVKEFVKVGQARKKDSDEMVRQIVDRGRDLSEQMVAMVQAELAKQMGKFAGRLDDVEARVEALAARVGLAAKATADRAADKATETATDNATNQATTDATARKLDAVKMAPSTPAPTAHHASAAEAPKADSQSE